MPGRIDLDLAHGRCAVIEIDRATDLAALPAAERARAERLPRHRQCELVAGRTALRLLLGAPDAVIATDDRGAPTLPAGFVGSVSHKAERVAAIVAPDRGARVGIDLERAAPPRVDIAARILTARELAALPAEPHARGRAVTLAFSIKEAIYKAVDPFVRRYVGFTEVELDVAPDGGATVTVLDRARLPLRVEAAWRELDGLWLATATASPWGA